VQINPRTLSEEHVRLIGERDEALRRAYDAVPAQYPAHAQPAGAAPVDQHAAFRKRLLYRSKQRGWCVAGGWRRGLARVAGGATATWWLPLLPVMPQALRAEEGGQRSRTRDRASCVPTLPPFPRRARAAGWRWTC
jgi:hypothetical protein